MRTFNSKEMSKALGIDYGRLMIFINTSKPDGWEFKKVKDKNNIKSYAFTEDDYRLLYKMKTLKESHTYKEIKDILEKEMEKGNIVQLQLEFDDEDDEPVREDIDLVEVQGEDVVTSSRIVAEVFGKEHRGVLRDIRNLIKNLGGAQKCASLFCKSEYVHPQNKQTHNEYLMNRDGFTLLAMGFTGKKATQWKLKYIEAFNKMEKALKEQQPNSYMITDPIERAKAWIEEEKERQLLAETVEKQKPKVEYVDKVLDTESTFTATQVAKKFGYRSAAQLNLILNELGIQYKQSGQWHLYSKYADKGYTKTATHVFKGENGYKGTAKSTKWTEKGINFIYNKLKENELI